MKLESSYEVWKIVWSLKARLKLESSCEAWKHLWSLKARLKLESSYEAWKLVWSMKKIKVLVKLESSGETWKLFRSYCLVSFNIYLYESSLNVREIWEYLIFYQILNSVSTRKPFLTFLKSDQNTRRNDVKIYSQLTRFIIPNPIQHKPPHVASKLPIIGDHGRKKEKQFVY